jgi:DNA modification methylase
MSIQILIGDCREVLATLPADSVHCVVTSPPYWCLRDYGVAGQIGLEASYQDYVAEMVAVFRDVRRVLRPDGTLWVNLGSSYASGGMNPSRFPERGRAPAYGSDGKGLADSHDAGCACPDCGGELTACSRNHPGRNSRIGRPTARQPQQHGQKGRDNGHRDSFSEDRRASAPDAQQSTILSSNANAVDVCDLAMLASKRQSEHPTLLGDAQQYAHNSVCTNGTAPNAHPSFSRTSDMVFVCTACGYSTRMYPTHKPKDLVNIPFFISEALRADGWWLRQDIIWSKSNPMPESVTDRCTKAHEYLFLLSKSERYHYDAEAIAESLSPGSVERYGYAFGGAKSEALIEANKTGVGQRTRVSGERETPTKRNKRSVWEVATQPFSEAHFATFPPALIEPCILAGCPNGGVVLDPFGGAGTTGLVADRNGRNAILIELNPEYAAMAKRRIDGDAGMFSNTSLNVNGHQRRGQT